MSNINKNIRYLRRLRGWTQEQLAMKLRIKRPRLGSWEEERCEPPTPIVKELGRIFKITMDDLYNVDLSERKAQIKDEFDVDLEKEESSGFVFALKAAPDNIRNAVEVLLAPFLQIPAN